MNETTELTIGVIISSAGTIINLIMFALSGLEFGFFGNMIYLIFPFGVGFSLVIHSMSRTLKRAKKELNEVRK